MKVPLRLQTAAAQAARAGAALILAVALLEPGPTAAANPPAAAASPADCALVVTSTADSGAGSLREAIACAVAGDTITFDPTLTGGTITLTSAPLTIVPSLTIDGTGAPGLTLSGNNARRIFTLGGTNPITITTLALVHGAADLGGAIWSSNPLYLEQVSFADNSASSTGGAVYVLGASAQIITGTFSYNSAGSGGGGAVASINAPLELRGGTLSHNSSTGQGGAVHVSGMGTLVMSGTVLSSNQSTLADHPNIVGGGAAYAASGAVLTNTVFTSNLCDGDCYGGALFVQAGPVEAAGSTFTSNACSTSGCQGGAIYSTGPLTVTTSLFQGNACLAEFCNGGAVVATSRVVLTDTDFLTSTAQQLGGALYAVGAVSVSGGLFLNNKCQAANCDGGAVFSDAWVVFSGTTLVNNSSGDDGGAVYADTGATLTGGSLQGNACLNLGCHGGGLYTAGPLSLSNVEVISNTSRASGGAVFAAGVWDHQVSGGRIEGNSCSVGGCSGGGLYLEFGTLALTSTQVFTNTAFGLTGNEGGGGIWAFGPVSISAARFQGNSCGPQLFCVGGGLFSARPVEVADTDFVANYATSAGGGLYAFLAITITESTFEQNACTGGFCSGGGAYSTGSAVVTSTSFYTNYTVNQGGGLWAGNTALLTEVVFQGNAGARGGGLAAADVVLTDTSFYTNTGSAFAGGAFVFLTVQMTGGRFQGNSTSGHGGGLFTGASVISGTVFQNNTAGTTGGGLFVSRAALTNTQFLSNTAGTAGGGFYHEVWDLAELSSVTFQGNRAARGGALANAGALTATTSTFVNNRAVGVSGSNGLGGGVYSTSPLTITNSLLAGNTAENQGHALAVAGGATMLLHTTVTSASMASGPALYVSAGSLTLTNTLLANHSVGLQVSGGSAREDYTLFSGVTTPTLGSVSGGTGSLTGTAGFVDAPAGDFHLSGYSDALDAGLAAGVDVDFDGQARPSGPGVDIGFDELLQVAHLVTPTVAGGLGSLSPSTPQWVDFRGSLTVTITPDPGYHVLEIYLDGQPQGPAASFVLTNVVASHELSVTFALDTFTLTVAYTGTGSGLTTPAAGVYTYTYGTVVTITAAADTGSSFAGWSGACSGTAACAVTMTQDRAVTAAFAPEVFTLTVTHTGTGTGLTTPAAGVYTYTYGTVVTVTAAADSGSSFAGWSGDCNGTVACVVTMTQDRSVTAAFARFLLYLPLVLR